MLERSSRDIQRFESRHLLDGDGDRGRPNDEGKIRIGRSRANLKRKWGEMDEDGLRDHDEEHTGGEKKGEQDEDNDSKDNGEKASDEPRQ